MVKRISALFLLILSVSGSASNFPQKLVKYLETEDDCEKNISLWVLDGSPFGYIVNNFNNKKTPMIKKLKKENGEKDLRPYYYSINNDPKLGSIYYEVIGRLDSESSLPILKISYSGRSFTCYLNYVNDEELELLSNNVGSVGHELFLKLVSVTI